MFKRQILSAAIVVSVAVNFAEAQSDTAFVYQGSMSDNGVPANGSYNIDVTLWDAAVGGNQMGPQRMFNAHPVVDGVFTLDLDFADRMLLPGGKWLEFSINGTELSPRTLVGNAPFSIRTRGLNVGPDGKVGLGVDIAERELDIRGLRPVVRLTATEPLVTSFPSLDFRGGPGPSIFQALGAVRFFNENGEERALISVNKSGPTGASMNFSTTPSGVAQLSILTDTIRVHESIELLRRSDLATGAIINGDGSDSFLQMNGGDIGIGTQFPNGRVHAVNSANGGQAIRGTVDTAGNFNTGVWGESTVTSGDGVGVQGRAASAQASAMTAFNTSSPGGNAYGLFARSKRIGGTAVLGWSAASTGNGVGVRGDSSSTAGFDFYADGPGMNYGASSSIRWKHNVAPLEDPLVLLEGLRGVRFDWDSAHGGHHDIGMIAEEVGCVLPEVVAYEANGVDAIGMDYSKLSPLLVEAIKALRAEKDAEVAALRAENDELRARLERVEAVLLGSSANIAERKEVRE